MTCPLDAWSQLFRIDEAFLPGNDAQLEVICSEAAERAVSHIGIEYGHCVYNSEAIRQLRLKHARDGKLTLEVRANNFAAYIWVRDPSSRAWIEVSNNDPDTRDLTFAQVSMIERLRRMESSPDRKISRAEGRRLMRELVERAQAAKTIRGLPRLLRLLGVEDQADRSAMTEQHLKRIGAPAKPVEPAKPVKKRRQRADRADDMEPPPSDPSRSPRSPSSASAVPVYEVVSGGGDAH